MNPRQTTTVACAKCGTYVYPVAVLVKDGIERVVCVPCFRRYGRP